MTGTTTARSPTQTKSSGSLVRYLKTHQLYDQSTVIVVSDHGEGLGDHGEQGHGLFVYDDTLHVPLIIKPSAGEGAGRRVKAVVQLVDLVPTILDLVKAPMAGNLRGRSLTALLDSDRVVPGRPDLCGVDVRALSLRLGRVEHADRRTLSVYQGAARRAVRS